MFYITESHFDSQPVPDYNNDPAWVPDIGKNQRREYSITRPQVSVLLGLTSVQMITPYYQQSNYFEPSVVLLDAWHHVMSWNRPLVGDKTLLHLSFPYNRNHWRIIFMSTCSASFQGLTPSTQYYKISSLTGNPIAKIKNPSESRVV